ncbi:hypothetical protein RHO47_25820, partial [Salmonella enterica subsp. enterica serovar Typhimurium]|nr:hypothetical protein [Salmonella enterica subsp. enterica serovar Typhimurium]
EPEATPEPAAEAVVEETPKEVAPEAPAAEPEAAAAAVEEPAAAPAAVEEPAAAEAAAPVEEGKVEEVKESTPV